jgi:plastocyanin
MRNGGEMRPWTRAGFVALTLGGLVLAGCGGDDGDSGGDADDDGAPADVVALGNDELQFDKESYSATAGSITIELVNEGSLPHTLLFDEDDVDFDKLRVSGDGDTDRGTVELTPGTYTIYCDIVGHRSAGMEATLVVN